MDKKRVLVVKKAGTAALLAAVVTMSTVGANYSVQVSQAAENVTENGSVAFAEVNSVEEFMDYIDNDGIAASEDIIETQWKGKTDVHKIVLDKPGTLLVSMLEPENDVRLQLYSNFALTSQVDKDEDSAVSSRGNIAIFNVDAGTYYYRGNRWNGYKVVTVTTYIGFIPDDENGADTSKNQYDTSDDGIKTVSEIPTVADSENLVKYINSDEAFASQTFSKESKGESVRKFEIAEDGWILVYPLGTPESSTDKSDWCRWALYSNKDLTSRIFMANTVGNTNEEAYAVYLKAGTYYYDTWAWNSSGMNVATYLGFIPASYRIRVENQELSSDKKSVKVKFTGDSDYMDGALIRITEGYVHPADVYDDDIWKTSTRENAIDGDTAVITKNGTYTARVSNDADKAYCMVVFTVEGIDNTSGNISKPDSSNVDKNKTDKVSIPKIKQAKRNSKIIKGTSDKQVKIVVQIGNKIYNTKAGSTGTWKLKKGNKIRAWAVNSSSKKSKAVVYKVK